MNQNKPESDPRYDAFVRRAVQSRMVYTLQDADGFYAECPSEAYDDLGEPVPVYCFGTARKTQKPVAETNGKTTP